MNGILYQVTHPQVYKDLIAKLDDHELSPEERIVTGLSIAVNLRIDKHAKEHAQSVLDRMGELQQQAAEDYIRAIEEGI